MGIRDLQTRAPVLEAFEAIRPFPVQDSDRLPLVDLALPALRHIPDTQRDAFLEEVNRLSFLDGSISLFEYALRHVLLQAMTPAKHRKRIQIKEATEAISIVLSGLSRLGAGSEGEASSAFELAESRMYGYTAGKKLTLLPPEKCGLADLDRAFDRIACLHASFQQRLLMAGLDAIAHDDQIEPHECEAYRAFAAALRIPAPAYLGFGTIGPGT